MFPPTQLLSFALVLAAATAFTAPAAHAASRVLPPHETLVAAGEREYVRSAAVLVPIRADYAYTYGLSGKGVRIAVLDSGIFAAHREFSEALKLAQGFNAVTGSDDVGDKLGHGTHVAGIIAGMRDGAGMFGVAPGAQLLPIKVLHDSGTGTSALLDRGLRHAIGRASIANISIAASGRYEPGAVREAVQSGMLLVVAAGNEGAAHPSWPARFAREAWANNQIIAVGAVDTDQRMAGFSNRAGDAAAWYLVAPGVDITSAYPNGAYVAMSGTSMAAPVVSGAAALLKQRWPALRADQLADILFLTATDLGAPGIDAVYGRGLLNVEKALQPIGPVTTTTFNGSVVRVAESSLRPSSATGVLWALAALGNLHVAGLDDFRRDFQVDLGSAVSRPPALSLEQAFGGMDRRIEVGETVLANGARLTAIHARARGSFGAPSVRTSRLQAFSLVAGNGDGIETAFGAGGLATHYFGVGGLALANGLPLAEPALANPYFELVPGAAHAAIARQTGGFKLKFGVLSAGLNRMFASQDGPVGEGPVLPSRWNTVRADAALIEISRSFGDAALALSLSQTSEADAYLGTLSAGALSLGTQATTGSIQLAGAVLLAPKLALAGQAAYGLTPAMHSRNSLITAISGLRTNAFSLALIASDRLRKGDRLSIALSQPMRTYAGRMTMDVLSGIDAAGAQIRERLQFSMMPLGRELKLEAGYRMPAGKQASAAATLVLRRQPNHLAQAPMESLLALRYEKRF